MKRIRKVVHIERSPMTTIDEASTIETNAIGGKQSKILSRADLLDGTALLRLTRVLHEGAAKYGDNNWRKISRASHVNHALTHILEALRDHGRLQVEEELDHAFCRLMMAIATE